MKPREKLKFAINNSECIFRTLTPEDVSQSYVNALKKTRGLIENVPEEIKVGFKAICTVHNTTMRDALLKYITSRVEQETKRTNEGLVVKIK